jgi:S1 RNA binding domain protein
MEITVGTLLEGKVKTITKFGAFISLPENHTGMVHISEVAGSYVNDIREHLTEGQEVRVKVLSVAEDGKIALSIKRALEPVRTPKPRTEPRPQAPKEPQTFEEKLKQFMSDSDSKISACGRYERKTKSRKR